MNQDRLGWDAAVQGRWSNDWIAVQQAYLDFIESKLSGKRWLIELIKKTWDIAWDLWEDRNGENATRKSARLKTEM